MANATRPEPSLREDPWHVDNCSMPRLRLAFDRCIKVVAGGVALLVDCRGRLPGSIAGSIARSIAGSIARSIAGSSRCRLVGRASALFAQGRLARLRPLATFVESAGFSVSLTICRQDLSPGFVARGSIAMSQMTNLASHATEGYTITLAWA